MFVVTAGMPRSGSTWLYNVIRVLLKEYKNPGVNCLAGWVDDIPWREHQSNVLIKVHEPLDELFHKADVVFYSYRDLRDVLASLQRKFANIPSIALVDTLVRNGNYWSEKAAYSMKYESMLASPESVILEIGRTLQIESIDIHQVLKQIELLNYQVEGDKNERYHRGNLYHKDHITNGKEGSWKGQLSHVLVNDLETKYGNWFIEHNYLLSNV